MITFIKSNPTEQVSKSFLSGIVGKILGIYRFFIPFEPDP